MTILEMQEAIKARGWQWVEHVFNDGLAADCFIELTRSIGPNDLSNYPKPPDTVGWGRFTRESCWSRAYRYCVTENGQ